MPKLIWARQGDSNSPFYCTTTGSFDLWLGQSGGCHWYGVTPTPHECQNCGMEDEEHFLLERITDVPIGQGDIVNFMEECEALLIGWLQENLKIIDTQRITKP